MTPLPIVDSSTQNRQSSMIVVNEIFGPVFQGEGPTAGQPRTFVRLGGCNLRCVWCDSKHTWDWEDFDPHKELHPMTVIQLINEIDKRGAPGIVVTGGEPMLQQERLVPLLRWLYRDGTYIEVETAGTIVPSLEMRVIVSQWNVSPKLGHSGNYENKRLRPEALSTFAAMSNAYFKFVCSTPAHLREVSELVNRFGFNPRKVFIMPEGTTQEKLLETARHLEPSVLHRGWSLTLRQHILLHGDKRGT